MATSNLQAELRELREQMSELSEIISTQARRRGRDARHEASSALHSAARRAGDVADYARDGIDSMTGMARRHPAATSTALLTLGLIGIAIGYMAATSTPPVRDKRWHW
ncbi:hypothetical protein FE840_008685 [Peteryoungia desertarenae]|uniref:Uncharacterized protein n=1 Tax=Peteryoungia desertarenae TaxID=1813451 RepID=A0ABX6QMB3_9HYPH|nr:hypothetical protein [Peteryoungia desertarenae]QLF69612.1 hypothetical protein FE840_008685 [Peteryoungia desertarenae]